MVDAIRPEHKHFERAAAAHLLARFGLTGDTALQTVGKLSGGERCRVALARLAAAEANFLVLDEPTNHLDLWARDSLEKAVARFRRDRALRQPRPLFRQPRGRSPDGVRARRVRVIEGNYDEYQRMLSGGKPNSQPAENAAPKKPAPSVKWFTQGQGSIEKAH